MNRAPAVVATVVLGAVIIRSGLLGEVHRIKDVPGVDRLVAAARGDEPDRVAGRCSSRAGIPARYCRLYKQAAGKSSCDVSWRVLAAIGHIESRHGANTGPSSAGALGPMQFMPATWRAYGRDGDRDGRKDVHDPADAIPAAAGYLCANHADTNLRGAIWHYNHSDRYVRQVLAEADRLR